MIPIYLLPWVHSCFPSCNPLHPRHWPKGSQHWKQECYRRFEGCVWDWAGVRSNYIVGLSCGKIFPVSCTTLNSQWKRQWHIQNSHAMCNLSQHWSSLVFNHSMTNAVGSQHCWSILAVGRTCVTCEPSTWPSFPRVSQCMGHRFQSWPFQWRQWLDARPRPVELIKPTWEQVSWASLLTFWTVRGRKWGSTCVNCVEPLKAFNSQQH